jgi:hypothetical protein
MTDHYHITNIAKLFNSRALYEQRKAALDAALDSIEDAGLYPGEAYDLVDRQVDQLHDRLIELDQQIAAAPIEADTDRTIIARVAQWRANEQDCGLSEPIAARLAVRLGPVIAIAFALILTGAAYAGDRDRLDPAYQGGDIHICRGLLTSSGTCIGSESNVEPDSYYGVTIYREHRERDGQDGDRHRDRDDE